MSFPDPTSKPVPLNPGMVYRPLSPGSDEVTEPFRLRITLVRYLRFISFIINIIAIFAWTAVGLKLRPWSPVIYTFLWLTLAVNFIALPNQARLRRKRGSSQLSCQIGIFQCSCGRA